MLYTDNTIDYCTGISGLLFQEEKNNSNCVQMVQVGNNQRLQILILVCKKMIKTCSHLCYYIVAFIHKMRHLKWWYLQLKIYYKKKDSFLVHGYIPIVPRLGHLVPSIPPADSLELSKIIERGVVTINTCNSAKKSVNYCAKKKK